VTLAEAVAGVLVPLGAAGVASACSALPVPAGSGYPLSVPVPQFIAKNAPNPNTSA
jgi:hypothetical protein